MAGEELKLKRPLPASAASSIDVSLSDKRTPSDPRSTHDIVSSEAPGIDLQPAGGITPCV